MEKENAELRDRLEKENALLRSRQWEQRDMV